MTDAIPIQPDETVKAAEAFAMYVGMGHKRSIRGLASILVEQNHYKTTATAESILNKWSSKYRWQERIAAAVTEKSDRLLAQAAELDADSFRRTSELLRERLVNTKPEDTTTVISIRESVRRPAPKQATGAGVNVQISVSLRDLAQRVAIEAGLDPEEVVAEAERILTESVS